MEYQKNFSVRLNEIMEERELTTDALSTKTNIASSNISKWLNRISIPNLSSLLKLSAYLCCTIDFLSGRAHENYYSPLSQTASFANRLRDMINHLKLSDYAFAKKTGIPRNTLHYWLTGKAEPLLDSLVHLADQLDCTIDYLVGRE